MLLRSFATRGSILISAASSFPYSSATASRSSSCCGGLLSPSFVQTFTAYQRRGLGFFGERRGGFGIKSLSNMASSSVEGPVEDGGECRSRGDKLIGRVALLQFHVSYNKEQNLQTASDFLSRARDAGAQIAVLPEIWNGPYSTLAFSDYAEAVPSVGEDPLDVEYDNSPSVRFLVQKAQELDMWIVGGSISEREDAESRSNGSSGGGGEIEKPLIFNTCICINPHGKIIAKHRKVHLFDIDVPGKITFRESDTLSPGSTITTFNGPEPFGKIGVGICYDIRFPELAQCMVQRGCCVLIYPGAFNLTTGPAHWELLQRARAVDGQCFVLTASPARSSSPAEGEEKPKYPHYTAWGHSTAVSPWGEVLATCDEKDHVVIVDLDMSKVEDMRSGIPTSLQKRNDLYSMIDQTVLAGEN